MGPSTGPREEDTHAAAAPPPPPPPDNAFNFAHRARHEPMENDFPVGRMQIEGALPKPQQCLPNMLGTTWASARVGNPEYGR